VVKQSSHAWTEAVAAATTAREMLNFVMVVVEKKIDPALNRERKQRAICI